MNTETVVGSPERIPSTPDEQLARFKAALNALQEPDQPEPPGPVPIAEAVAAMGGISRAGEPRPGPAEQVKKSKPKKEPGLGERIEDFANVVNPKVNKLIRRLGVKIGEMWEGNETISNVRDFLDHEAVRKLAEVVWATGKVTLTLVNPTLGLAVMGADMARSMYVRSRKHVDGFGGVLRDMKEDAKFAWKFWSKEDAAPRWTGYGLAGVALMTSWGFSHLPVDMVGENEAVVFGAQVGKRVLSFLVVGSLMREASKLGGVGRELTELIEYDAGTKEANDKLDGRLEFWYKALRTASTVTSNIAMLSLLGGAGMMGLRASHGLFAGAGEELNKLIHPTHTVDHGADVPQSGGESHDVNGVSVPVLKDEAGHHYFVEPSTGARDYVDSSGHIYAVDLDGKLDKNGFPEMYKVGEKWFAVQVGADNQPHGIEMRSFANLDAHNWAGTATDGRHVAFDTNTSHWQITDAPKVEVVPTTSEVNVVNTHGVDAKIVEAKTDLGYPKNYVYSDGSYKALAYGTHGGPIGMLQAALAETHKEAKGWDGNKIGVEGVHWWISLRNLMEAHNISVNHVRVRAGESLTGYLDRLIKDHGLSSEDAAEFAKALADAK